MQGANGKSLLQRGLLIASVTFILLGVLQFLDAVPGGGNYTYTHIYGVNRLGKKPAGPPEHPKPVEETQLTDSCPDKFEYLKRLSLSESVKYSRRCLRPAFPRGVDRDGATNITASLFNSTISINTIDPCSNTALESILAECDPIELPVPVPDPENKSQYGHLIFGVATTYKRLCDSKLSFAHWLAHSGATLVGLITDNNDPSNQGSEALDLSALQVEYESVGVQLQLVPKHDQGHTTEQSHMMIIADMLAASKTSHDTHWLGILDDDTFFPSLHALATTLEQYDHTRPQYLGQLTENADMVPIGILGAFGGAGIFLSRALAEELEPHLDSCRSDVGGDIQIMQCVHVHSATRLTRVQGLWQADIVGDSAGFYESGRRMLSMHHWKSWNHLPVVDMAAVTRICGGCFLQRFVFREDGTEGQQEARESLEERPIAVLNNGYSINLYTAGVQLPDLSRTEQTWDDWDRDPWKDYQWSLGPLRNKMNSHEKKSYWLEAADMGAAGELTQVYLHRTGEGKEDEVIELVWKL